MAAGLRATAKALEHPPEPNVGAPVLDPTDTLLGKIEHEADRALHPSGAGAARSTIAC